MKTLFIFKPSVWYLQIGCLRRCRSDLPYCRSLLGYRELRSLSPFFHSYCHPLPPALPPSLPPSPFPLYNSTNIPAKQAGILIGKVLRRVSFPLTVRRGQLHVFQMLMFWLMLYSWSCAPSISAMRMWWQLYSLWLLVGMLMICMLSISYRSLPNSPVIKLLGMSSS